jgi:mitofilin
LTLGFYGGSTLVALGSEEYRNWFIERMPFAERIIHFTDSKGWDRAVVKTKATSDRIVRSAARLERKVEESLPKPAQEAIASTKEAVMSSAHKVSDIAHGVSDKTQKAASDTLEAAKEKTARLRAKANEAIGKGVAATEEATKGVPRPSQFSAEVEDLVKKAEDALKTTVGNLVPIASVPPTGEQSATSSQPAPPLVSPPPTVIEALDPNVWSAPLPLGFEPPPGYKLPKSKPKADPSAAPKAPLLSEPPKLPLIAPEVKELASAEPIIGQLAATIDSLSTLVQSTPNASEQAKSALAEAKVELKALANRIDQARTTERERLTKKVNDLNTSLNKRILELDMAARDKFDTQEENWKQAFDAERQKVVSAYKEKLEMELETQSAIINERYASATATAADIDPRL